MSLFNSTAFRITEQGLDALWAKQQIISHNIANASTPGYKARYVQFSAVLKEKMLANGKTKKELNLAHNVVVDNNTADQPDGNNVDEEVQSIELARARLQYDALISQMNGDLTMMKSAIRSK